MRPLLATAFGALIAAALLQLGDTPNETPSPPTQDVTPLFIPDAAADEPVCTPVMDRMRLLGCPLVVVIV